jgi:hypothetical protein
VVLADICQDSGAPNSCATSNAITVIVCAGGLILLGLLWLLSRFDWWPMSLARVRRERIFAEIDAQQASQDPPMVHTSDGVEFTVETEPGWFKPLYRTGARGPLATLSGAASQYLVPPRGRSPHWRVVLKGQNLVFAASPWSTDWPVVESTMADWRAVASRLTAVEIEHQTAIWN